MTFRALVGQYVQGPALLRDAIAGMTENQWDAVPIEGQWSTRQVICHLADFEIVYADRIKRVLSEDRPTFFGGDPDTFAAHLGYDGRLIYDEIKVIQSVRRQVASILSLQSPNVAERVGLHHEDGPKTLTDLLQAITKHVPHHIEFIKQKRRAFASN